MILLRQPALYNTSRSKNHLSEESNQSSFTPEGWHTVTPRIVAHDAKRLVAFIKHVFDTTGEYSQDRPSMVLIGDSLLMISDAGIRNSTTAFLYVYVNDTDATFKRAVAAGARAIEDPSETPYGDRRCMLEDEWGNTWQIATYKPKSGSSLM